MPSDAFKGIVRTSFETVVGDEQLWREKGEERVGSKEEKEAEDVVCVSFFRGPCSMYNFRTKLKIEKLQRLHCTPK